MVRLSSRMLRMFIAVVVISAATTGHAGTKTFSAGSYIIPQDLCWQPTKYYPDNPRPLTVEICGNSFDDDGDGVVDEANTVANPYNCYNLAGCDTDKKDQAFFQATGLIYEILTAGYPVYWVINPTKTNQLGVDMSLLKSGSSPAVTIYNSAKADSGSLSTVNYIGGPFVIDANDYDSAMQALFTKYGGANGVKLHKANYDFSADVDKVLSGKPPDVAVLGEGATQVLTDYLFASGLGNQQAIVFKYLSSNDIKNDKLADYQLLWAPHWIVTDEVPVAADRPIVLGKIRSFLEGGNAGFFECASIETLERSVEGTTSTPPTYIAGQGLLLDKNYSTDFPTSKGRLEADGGTQNYQKIKLEKLSHVLAQCGGWRYNPTGGHVHNFRPNEQPTPDFVYNSTVDRFIHDDEALGSGATGLGYTGKGYDYFAGGRINGSATQGYVAYLAGHTYVKCTNATTSNPSTRFFEFDFTASPALLPTTIIQIEAVYAGCVPGSTCPKATYNLASLAGGYNTDGTLFVDLDSVEYAPDADPASKFTLKNIMIGNNDKSAGKTLTGITVTFDGNSTTTLLTQMRDVTLASSVICSPNSPTPASCPSLNAKKYDVNFDADLAGSIITVEVLYGTCAQGTTCPKGTFNTGTSTPTSGSDGTIFVDMSGVTYDAVNKKLKNVRISNQSAAAKTLTRFYVSWTASPAAKLTTIQDVTLTPTTICASNSTTTAACPPFTVTPVANANSFEFKEDFTTGTITIEVVHAGCSKGSTCSKATATATLGNPTGGTISQTDGKVKIDMSAATFNHGNKKLNNVILTNLTGATITVTAFEIYVQADKKLTKIKDGTNKTVYDSDLDVNPASVATLSPQEALLVSTTGDVLNISLTASSPLSVSLAAAVTQCDVDWSKANACGMKYVLNTLIGLQFQIIPREYNKAGAIQQDNILYKGAFEFPGYKGHLYAINVLKSPAETLWDAGHKNTMPPAGTVNPASPSKTNASRYIFTNLPGTTTKLNFDVNNVGAAQTDATKLWKYLYPTGTQTQSSVKALINSVRGRKDANETLPAGSGEVSKRLGGIEHSAPAVMRKSKLAGSASRDRVIFVGANDGMLHAFYAGQWDSTLNSGKGAYANVGTGKEIWAYIPSKLLSSLQNHTFTDCNPDDDVAGVCPTFSVAVAVDGSPALGDFFVDHDNNASTPKEWRTILVATAKVLTPGDVVQPVNQGIIFALDVTDPYAPALLWERTYDAAIDTTVAPGNAITRNYYPAASFPTNYKTGEDALFDPNMGNSKGVSIGRVQVGTTLDTYVFLTSRWVRKVNIGTVAAPHDVSGFSVFALDFFSGDIKWETKILYSGDAEGVDHDIATPGLLDYGNNGTYDYVVFGDMQGRLWVLKTIDGKSLTGDLPAFTVGLGAKEPIGVPVAIYNNTILFGTGGRDSLQDESTTKYHVYAIEINSSGEVKSLWTPPLELLAGEKVWSSPVIDSAGNVYVGTAKGYTDVGRPDQVVSSSGRLLVLELATGKLRKDGAGNDMAIDVGGAVIGDIAVENNHVTVQSFNGSSIQVGAEAESSFDSVSSQRNPVRVLWWRKL